MSQKMLLAAHRHQRGSTLKCDAEQDTTAIKMSALGQKQTYAVQKRHVRFTPKSRLAGVNRMYAKCPKSGDAAAIIAPVYARDT